MNWYKIGVLISVLCSISAVIVVLWMSTKLKHGKSISLHTGIWLILILIVVSAIFLVLGCFGDVIAVFRT